MFIVNFIFGLFHHQVHGVGRGLQSKGMEVDGVMDKRSRILVRRNGTQAMACCHSASAVPGGLQPAPV
jgi:hypothetical protein